MSSVSPLSGYNSSGSRRKRRETSGGGGGGSSCSSVFSSSSPFSVADVPPIFPLSIAPRPRRPSGAGAVVAGLPPPVPVAHTYSAPSGSNGAAERSTRSTWRSVSPSRAGEDRGWSISPVLAARAGTNRNEVSPVVMGKTGTDGVGVAYAPPSARTRLGGDDERRDGGETRARLPLPTHGAPKREAGRATGTADVAKLGRAMGMISTEGPPEPVRAFGAQTAGVCETKRDGPPEPSAGAAETVTNASGGGDAGCTPSSVAVASNQGPCADVAGREDPVEELKLPCEHGNPSAPAATPQTQSAPPTSSTSDQGWMTGLSEAALPDAGGQEPASSSDLSKAAGAASDGVFRDDNNPQDISAAFGSEGGSASTSPQMPPASASNAPGEPPAAERTAAVPEALSVGVAAGPSPFVNTSSPLTRSRNKAGQEQSMFGVADCAVDGESETCAADLFATEAPARAADELFSSGPGAAAVAAGNVDVHRGGSSGGSGNDTSVFSQGPPPETPAVPPPSLPNPWGSSPLKQPLPEPKRWPTKGGTGFDRPLTPLAATEKASEAGPPQAGGAEAGAGARAGDIPSAFFGPGSGDSGDDNNGGFGDGDGGPEGQAFDKSPVAGPLAGMSPAKPWESGGSSNAGGPSSGVPGETASRTNSSASPAPSKLAFSRFGAGPAGGYKGFSGRSEASGGAWGGSSALAAAAEMAAATVTAGADRATREQGVTPAGVIASFGFGGKLVAMHPRRKIKLAPAPRVPPTLDDGPALRKGPVNVSPSIRYGY